MFVQKSQHICEYWDCNNTVTGSDYLCPTHHQKWLEGVVDRCPRCSRFKDSMYRFCLDCYLLRPVKKRKPVVVRPKKQKSPREQYTEILRGGYPEQERYFIYVIEFDDGAFYVGHTQNIRSRLSGLGKKKTSDSGYNPKLLFLEIVTGEKDAELRESRLKELVKSDPEQVRSMASDFHREMQELGFE